MVTLWSVPGPDDPFSKEVKQNRVLTIHQDRTAADFGEAGFHQSSQASYLVFPKPLAIRPGDRIVGIKYDLLGGGRTAGAAAGLPAKTMKAARRGKPVKALPPPKPATVVRAPKPAPVEVEFAVRFRRTATVDGTMTVMATSKAEAVEKAKALAKDWAFDLSKAMIENKVGGVMKGSGRGRD